MGGIRSRALLQMLCGAGGRRKDPERHNPIRAGQCGKRVTAALLRVSADMGGRNAVVFSVFHPRVPGCALLRMGRDGQRVHVLVLVAALPHMRPSPDVSPAILPGVIRCRGLYLLRGPGAPTHDPLSPATTLCASRKAS